MDRITINHHKCLQADKQLPNNNKSASIKFQTFLHSLYYTEDAYAPWYIMATGNQKNIREW